MAVTNLATHTVRPRPGPGAADLRPCRRCGQTNPRRMIALMSLWFGPVVGVRPESGYFYLCPACYQSCVAPHAPAIMLRLADSHPARRGSTPRPPQTPPPNAFS